jgi:hypothetical protein
MLHNRNWYHNFHHVAETPRRRLRRSAVCTNSRTQSPFQHTLCGQRVKKNACIASTFCAFTFPKTTLRSSSPPANMRSRPPPSHGPLCTRRIPCYGGAPTARRWYPLAVSTKSGATERAAFINWNGFRKWNRRRNPVLGRLPARLYPMRWCNLHCTV